MFHLHLLNNPTINIPTLLEAFYVIGHENYSLM